MVQQYRKEMQLLSKRLLHPHVTVAKTWKQSNCPLINDKENGVHTHTQPTRMLFTQEKKGNL